MNQMRAKFYSHCLAGWLAGVCLMPPALAEPVALPLEDLQVFAETYAQIKRQYVQPSDDRALIEGAIRGMLSELDEHSAYLAPEDFSLLQSRSEGELVGIGVEITRDSAAARVVSVLDNSPAAEAGVAPGDTLVELDGQALDDWSLAKSAAQLRGRPGTWLKLHVLRANAQTPVELTIVRAPLRHGSVRSELLEGRVAYLRIAEFREPTASQLRQQIDALMQTGHLRGLVLDLRNNPGGRFPSALAVSDLFLASGNIVSVRQRNPEDGDELAEYPAEPDSVAPDVPMAVLIDRGSASAAEIVAAALQDHDRATLIGTQTYGKGSVQLLIELSNGGGLKLTTAHFYTPHGQPIQGVGVTPDVRVELAEGSEDDTQLDHALSWIETHTPRRAPTAG